MKIIIVGCGKIGTAILSSLSLEGHDIVAVDKCDATLKDIANIYDVMAVCGNGVDSDVLNEADANEADMFVAVTDSDEINMLSCFLAKKMGAQNTIARIRNPEYNDRSLDFMRENLQLSMAINPERLAAYELFNLLKFPSAVKIETFSRGNLEMIELKLKVDSALDGLSLIDMRLKYKTKVLVCYVRRDNEVFIPGGNFCLKSGDLIGITASAEEVQKLFKALGIQTKQAKNVMILGGSRTAHYLAEMLMNIGVSVKIVDNDSAVCEELCESLPKAVVINGDGTRQELLVEEGLRNLDAFVSLTGNDEENILISIFASSQNVPKVVSKVSREELIPLAENLGLDSLVAPQSTIADVILRYARALENSKGSNIETLYRVADGKAEVLEFNAREDERLTGISLKEMELKPNILIAGIVRHRKTIIPAGDDVILPGDSVIIIAADHKLQDLSDILK